MIIAEPCAGLGNRFLGIASAYHYAKQTGDELTVLWKSERVLGADYGVVFTLPEDIKIITAKDFGFKSKPISTLRYNHLEKKFRKEADFFADVEDTTRIFEEGGNEAFLKAIEGKDNKFLRVYSQFHDFAGIEKPLDFIKPSAYVTAKANEVISKIDAANNIGIHIRRTDNQVCINNSPLELFIEAMEREIALDDKVTFYIASDDWDTICELKKRFGERIYYMENKNFERDSNMGICDAYAELICLSHAKKIIGSFYSTYSRVGAMLSGIDLEVVKKAD